MGELREKCAVGAVVGSEDASVSYAAENLSQVLFALQHRGVEASGMATLTPSGELLEHRAPGTVRDVYDADILQRLTGAVAMGQNRYSTNGSKYAHLQPVIDKDIGFAMATNGNLPVTDHLERFLRKNNIRTAGLNDSEMKALAIAQYIRMGHDLADSIELASPLFRGSYSSIAMHGDEVIAFRDPKGIRPLELGVTASGFAIASETCGLDIIDAQHERTVKPGEMVIITPDGNIEYRNFADGEEKLDIFEFVYFARPDSILYGERVAMVRRRAGEELAEEHADAMQNPDALVIPVPETSIPIAEGFAKKLGLEHTSSAIIKNRYVGRTFMLQNQQLRQHHLRLKHNLIPELIKDRDIILIDDSLVRSNTARELVKLAREAGAKSVKLLLGSPPVRFPDFYGIDTPTQDELAAANMTIEQIKREIDADYLGFLSLSRLIRATNQPRERFNLSAFTGEYPIGIGRHKAEIRTPIEMSYID